MKVENCKELEEKKKFKSPEEFEKEITGKLSELHENGNWTFEGLLSLKEYLYPINNHITYLMGEKFLARLNTSTKDANFNYTEMNHNGYDIVTKINDSLIVAEIKGNIPCGKDNNSYGANQKNSIKKDIKNLKELKKKGEQQVNKLEFENAYKFLVLLKNNDNAINSLIKNLSDYNFVFLKNEKINLEKLKKDTIHIVLIDL